MGVNVSKFAKKKENSSSVTINNNSRGYSNTNNNYTASQLDRMLWNIHDTGQDINESLTLPALSVNGTITAGGRIHSDTEVGAPIGRFSYIYDCTEGHIDTLYSDHIDTQTLKVHDTAEITYLNSDRITTKYLDVTKSAHFAELVIDKIKSVGGSAVFSPADGFKLNTEDDIIYLYTENRAATGYCMLCWDAEDDRGATVNMWERGDQALCQNFNEATTGTSHNISNTYFWMYVFTAGTYDPQNPADIMYDHGWGENYIIDDDYKQETAYNSEGEKITFDNLKHYIIVYNNSSTFTDGENNVIDVREGNFNPKPGNEVVMLGHRARLDEMQNDDYGVPEYKKRQSAIYIAAYNSTIEPDLMAPLIAQYQGVNDFDLSSHRTTHFAAGHNDIFGYDNVIKGSFKTINGTDITDLTGVTYFIKTNKAYVPVSPDYSLDSSFTINIDCMYISGDSGPLYVGNRNSNMRLIVRCGRNNISKTLPAVDANDIKNTYPLHLGQLIAPSTVLSGKIDSLSFEIAEDTGSGKYNTLYQYNMPVIQLPDNISYTNTELYKLNPMIELAQVDVTGNFALYLQYQVQYIIGNTITNVGDEDYTDYSVQFVIWDENQQEEHTKNISYNSTKGCFEYNKSTEGNYEKTNVFGTYGGRSLLHDQYIEVSLIKNNGSVVLDKRVIPITLVAGAMFSITDEITSRVTANETTANTALNMASEAKQTAEGFDQRVTKTETDINNQKDTITGLQTDISRIQQTADSITSEVTKISGVGGENLLVNSCFQVSEENDLPEKWNYYNENTILKCESEGSINYVNINNNKDNPNSGDGRYRGIEQKTQDRFDTAVQDFYPNHIYCFSFYGKKNSTYGEISCFIHYLDSNGTHFTSQSPYQDQTYCDFDLTDDWQRYAFIFKTPDNNIIYSFNIMLEYYGNIKRGGETTIPVRENDVDIMMPMLLDFGVVSNERMDMYGLYTLYGESHIYDKWINTDYNVNSVPRWQGNSQDVSVSSSQIEQTAELIRAQVGSCGINITDKQITLNGNTIVNGQLDLNSGEGFNLNNEDGSLGAKIHGGEIPNISDWKSSTNADIVKINIDQYYFENTETSQGFNLNYNLFNLGYLQPLDVVTINMVVLTSNFPLSSNGLTFNIYDDNNNIVASKVISSMTNISTSPYRYRININLTYTSNLTARNFYFGYDMNLSGSPHINTNNFSIQLNYNISVSKLIEMGSNGLATRVDTNNYMYMGESAFEVRHGNNGLQVYNSDGHIPASGQYGYGVKRYYNDTLQNGWFPILTPSLYVLSGSSFLWGSYTYDMVITNYNSSSTDVTIYLPTDRWRGRVCYIRKAGVSNVIVYTSGSDYMYLSQASGRTNVSNRTITNGDMYMFVYTGQGTETVGRWVVNRLPNP